MKGFMALLGFGIVIILFGSFLTGIHNARVATYTQVAPSVVTGGGDTSTNVTLIEPLFGGNIPNVLSITSSYSDVSEAPQASSYVSNTRVLTIIGLAASETRNLSITYQYGNLDATSDTFMGMLPLLMIVGGVIICVVSVIGAVHK